jgi:hypothetical protein
VEAEKIPVGEWGCADGEGAEVSLCGDRWDGVAEGVEVSPCVVIPQRCRGREEKEQPSGSMYVWLYL